MTYKQAIDHITECASYGISPGLESITGLCQRLGDPQDELKFIHIAGTNGKGSVAAYLSSIFKSAGLKVGRYISPTISDYLERFDINGRCMTKKDFARYMDIVRPVCDAMTAEGLDHPTPFEMETAIAFLYFKEKNCDIVVLECGMGGRLDATNIIRNKLSCVFAHIDMDHMQYLGDTVDKIASEKAGIITDTVPVITGPQYEAVMKVLRKAAVDHDADIYTVKDDKDVIPAPGVREMSSYISGVKINLRGGSFYMSDEPGKRKYKTPLLGTHQIINSAVAVRCAQAVREACEDGRYDIGDDLRARIIKGLTEESIAAGLKNVKWPARLQIISTKPLTVIDGAHNPDAAARLKESLDELIPGRDRILIMGMLKDKDAEKVADIMCRDAMMVFTVTPPDNPRAMRSPDLARIVSGYNPRVTSLDSVEEAVEMARMFAVQNDNSVIIAFGSLSYMGRMLKIYNVK